MRHANLTVEGALATGRIGFFDWDVAGKRLFVDPIAATFLAVSPAVGAVGIDLDRLRSRLHPDDAERFWQEAHRAKTGANLLSSHVRLLGADEQEQSWYLVHGRCGADPDGRAIRYSGVVLSMPEQAPPQADKILDSLADIMILARSEAAGHDDGFLLYLIEMALLHIAESSVRT